MPPGYSLVPGLGSIWCTSAKVEMVGRRILSPNLKAYGNRSQCDEY